MNFSIKSMLRNMEKYNRINPFFSNFDYSAGEYRFQLSRNSNNGNLSKSDDIFSIRYFVMLYVISKWVIIINNSIQNKSILLSK